MIKEEQTIEIKITGCSINWYKSKGYICKVGETIQVKPEELPNSSHHKITVICDDCGREYTKQYRDYLKRVNEHPDKKFVCQKCCSNDKYLVDKKVTKAKQTFLDNYGVDNPNKVPEIKEKVKQTVSQKYGVEYYFQTEEMKEKSKKTIQEKYGVDSYLQCEGGKEKLKNTFLKKYGKDNPMKVDEFRQKAEDTTFKNYGVKNCASSPLIKEKVQQTNLRKYGVKFTLSSQEIRKKGKETILKKYKVDNPAKSLEIQRKIRRTLFKHGKTRTSKQQKEIFDILNNKYGECKLNYPFHTYSFDCMLIINDVKIDIEYDGWYWHNLNDMSEKDKVRDEKAIEEGYKILRIKGGREIPSSDKLFEAIQELLDTELNFKEIILPEWEKNIIQHKNHKNH